MTRFKKFVLNEQKKILNDRIGPIVNAIDSLQNDAAQMGSRQIIKTATNIANEIRKILNDDWDDSDTSTLKELQKVAVFILKSIDTSEDLKGAIDQTAETMHNLAGKDTIQTNSL
jgi:hypothetical protein